MFGSCPSANSLEDALGRINLVTAEDTNEPMSIQFQEDVNSLRLAQRNDPCLRLILQWANAEKHPDQNPLRDLKIKKANAIAQGEDAVAMWGLWDQMELTDGVLYRKWHVEGSNTTQKQLVVPQGLRETVLDQLHDSKLSGGHFAFQKTLDRARQRFWWTNMRKDLERKCENCTLCQARSTAGKKRIAPLQTINVGIRFSKVAADIRGPVTRAKTSGAKYILVLTDYLTKYVVCVPLERTTAEDVARAIVEKWVLTFGAPDCLHTDQGSNFCSELLLEVCKSFGIEKTRTSPYHPQGNGMVERHNRVVADVISKYCANNPSSWDQMIPYLNFVYNTTVHKTTGQTPFSLVFGQECKYPIDLLLPKAPGHEIAKCEFARWLNEQFREAHMNARETLVYKQERQKDMYQKNVFGEELKPGERVWLFAPHKAKSKKFFLPWDGPYNIIEKTSEVNYKISKDANAKKWQIVHYNRLKPVKEENELPRMETRSSHQEKWPSHQNTNDQEVPIEVNNQTFTPEVISKRPKQESPFKWMDEDKDFFYDLFAEREHSTKRPTKTNIGAEPNTPEQATNQENQTPFVTPAKEIDSAPLPQRPHKPKNVLRDLSEIQSTPASAKREMCKPKTFAELLGTKTDETVNSIAKTRERRAVK